MALKTFRRYQGDYALNSVQKNVEEYAKTAAECILIDGVLLTDIEIVGAKAENLIEHGLGRNPKGWFVTRTVPSSVSTTDPAPLYEPVVVGTTVYDNRDKMLILSTPGDTMYVDIWVF